jgi:WD40 repeat protein
VYRKLANPSGVAVSPDGHQFAGAAGNGVAIWNLATKSNPPVLDGHEGNVRQLVYSRDGKQLATGGLDRTIQVWDMATGRLSGSYQGHSKEVTCIRLSPDGQSIAGSSRDGSLRVWKIREQRSEKDLDFASYPLPWLSRAPGVVQHGDAFESLAFSDDGKRIYYLFGAQQWRIFLLIIDSNLLSSVARYADVVGLSPQLDKVAQLISGRIVIKGAGGRVLGICNIDPSLLMHPVAYNALHTLREMIVLDDKTYLLNIKRGDQSSGRGVVDPRTDIYLGVWNNAAGDWRWLNRGVISGRLMDAEGRTVDTIHDDFAAATVLPRSGNLIGVQGRSGMTADGKTVGEWRRSVAILDIQTGRVLAEYPGDSFRTDRNGDLLAVGGGGKLEVWSLKENTRIDKFDGDQCTFDASGKLLAIRTKGSATIWELRPRRKLYEFKVGSAVNFSPDGRRVVASLGKEVMIIDPVAGKVLLKLHGESDYFVFSPDGRTIASAMGKLVRFWVADPTAGSSDPSSESKTGGLKP